MGKLERPGVAALICLPGALTVYLSFNGGGFFVGASALVAVALVIVAVLRVTLAERPFAGLSRPAVAVLAPLSLFAIWTLVSALWSDSPARALLEFDRVLVYLLALAVFASLPRSSTRLAWMLRALALAIVAVCLVGLTTRLAPDVWPIATNIENDRLSYPLTYWNALGLLAGFGVMLCFHLSAAEREPLAVRVLATAAVPALAATLLLTFSRGAIVALGLGLAVYLIAGRPRLLLGAAAGTVPSAIVAVAAAYDAELLAKEDPTTAAAIAQGHELALTVGLCALAAAAVRALSLPLDMRLARLRLPASARRPVGIAAVVVPLVAAAVGLMAVDAPAYVERQYDRFVEGEALKDQGDRRSRLTDPGNNGRIEHWEAALAPFDRDPWIGNGAGTYEFVWLEERPDPFTVIDAHSLYVEVLGELGLVGLALIALALAALVVGLALRLRGRRSESRAGYAAVLAVTVAWVAHAGIDWDWEMPAVTLLVFALGGFTLAARRGPLSVSPRSTPRVAIALALLVLGVTPALIVLSQRHLNRAVAELREDDCEQSIDSALDSIGALSVRPEPWEVLAYCDARLGSDRLAERALQKAIDREPSDWRLRYGLALVRGAAGRDPLPPLRRALRLNPRERLLRDVLDDFEDAGPRGRRAVARQARLPLP